MSPSIDTHLRAFNRKERYWLLRNAIGSKFELLDRYFLNEMQEALSREGVSVKIPESAWFAFDYHFDWIYGAIVRYSQSVTDNIDLKSPRLRRLITGAENQYDIIGNQEDVDLLIAFGRTIILVEAKFEGSWGNTQFARKLTRYRDLDVFQRELLAESGDAPLELHFVLTSARRPRKLENFDLPWVRLECGEDMFSRVERCDPTGNPSKEGLHWQIVDRSLDDAQSVGQTGD